MKPAPILIGAPRDHDAELRQANRDGLWAGAFFWLPLGFLAGWVARMVVVP